MIRKRMLRVLALTFLSFSALPATAQSPMWIQQIGTGVLDAAHASALDGSGGVFLAGSTAGLLGGPSAGGTDAWLARYDAAGNQLWIRQLGSNGEDHANCAAPDGAGGVIVGGSTTDSLGGPNAGTIDAWLARYDGLGTQLWIRQLGSVLTDHARHAAIDGNGGVFISGETRGALGGPNAGSWDTWFARYDGTGNQLWIRQIGTGDSDTMDAATSDGSGGLYLGGATDGSLGGPNAGGNDAWLARYDSTGSQLWIRQEGTSSFDVANAVALDGSGGAYVGGGTYGSLGGPNAGNLDGWLARYDGAGNQLWIRQLGTTSYDYVEAAAPDTSSGVYVSGLTRGSIVEPNAGGLDVWLKRYDSAGDSFPVHQLGTNDTDFVESASPDGAGGVYLSGTTWGSLGGQNTGSGDVWVARYGRSVTSCPGKLVASGPSVGDGLGSSVFLQDDFAIVGAAESDALGVDSGAAYLFRRIGSSWSETTVMLPADGMAGDAIGTDVTIWGNVAVVGAPQSNATGTESGAAYVFRSVGSSWQQEQKLVGSDTAAFDEFGLNVAIEEDVIVVGAHQHAGTSGAVYVFRKTGSTWIEEAKLVGGDTTNGDHFGVTVSVSGDRIAVGSVFDDNAGGSSAGAAYVFSNVGGVWRQEAKVTASDGAQYDFFGIAVSLSGTTLLVGAEGDDDLGSIAGAAYVFDHTGGTWSETVKLTGADLEAGDTFGNAVSLSGTTAIVSSRGDDDEGPEAGAAYVFARVAGTWIEERKLTAPDGAGFDLFGVDVAVDGGWALVGAFGHDETAQDAGAAYVLPVLTTDCNGNMLPDACDIVAGTSQDLNGNGVPDECEPPIGTTYCSPNNGNSTGLPAIITAIGSLDVLLNDFALNGNQLPMGQFGYFLTSQTQGFVPFPGGSQGVLCLSGTIGRPAGPVFNSGADGVGSVQVDLTLLPLTPPVAAMPGETWNFQAWYRDVNPAPTSNFTDAVAVTFQ